MADKKISFFVGISPRNESKFNDLINNMNEDSDDSYSVFVQNQFQDPEGNINYNLKGSWRAYECFLNEYEVPGSFLKSLDYFFDTSSQ